VGSCCRRWEVKSGDAGGDLEDEDWGAVEDKCSAAKATTTSSVDY
jgi:hypothetical protein